MRFFFALLLLIPAVSQAEPLKAVLVVPPSAVAGSDIYLDASQSTGDIEHYLIFADLIDSAGRVSKKGDIVPATDKAKPRLRSFAGRWRVRLIVVASDGRYDETESVCAITAPDCPDPMPPTPGPQPKPDPGPLPPPPAPNPPTPPRPDEPVLPIGEFNIARPIYDLVKTIKSPTLAADAQKLAASVDGIAAQLAAGTLNDTQSEVNQIAAAVKALPQPWQEKLPEVGAILQKTVRANLLKMSDVKMRQKLYGEISAGLKAVK